MTGRLPSLEPAELDGAQRRLYDSLVANELPWADRSGVRAVATDGSLLGPFNPLLFSPALGTALVELFRAEKSNASLTLRVHEVVVLTVGAVWNSDYELYAHSAIAKTIGLPDTVIDAIRGGHPPALHSDEEAIAHELTRQLASTHRIDPNTYARAAQLFGHKGLVDMVILIGLYLATCSIINAFEVSVPEAVGA